MKMNQKNLEKIELEMCIFPHLLIKAEVWLKNGIKTCPLKLIMLKLIKEVFMFYCMGSYMEKELLF